MVRLFLGLVIGAMVPLGASAQTGGDSAARGKVTREADAILVDRCVSCHGPEQKKGGLDLSRRATAIKGGKSGTAIVPGSPDESLLVDKVVDGEMPPKGSLAREQVAAVRAWVEAGAPLSARAAEPASGGGGLVVAAADPDRCAPQWHRSSAGVGGGRDWVKTPIDAFILAGLKAEGLAPGPAADAATLIRRVTFDLTGLPPAPEAVDAFIAAAANRSAGV